MSAPGPSARPGEGIDATSEDRRAFLRDAAALAVGVAAMTLLPSVPVKASQLQEKRYAMLIDLTRCIGCQACVASCKAENNVPYGVFRTWVERHEKGTFPNVSLEFVPRLCNHCDNPPCVQVCPVGATYRREDGLVLIYDDRCIGCGACIKACPYGARYFNPIKKVADKCTFCQQRVDKGLEPACVTTCVGRARVFGDIADPGSEISKRISGKPVQVIKPQLGTEPMVFYIGLDTTKVK